MKFSSPFSFHQNDWMIPFNHFLSLPPSTLSPPAPVLPSFLPNTDILTKERLLRLFFIMCLRMTWLSVLNLFSNIKSFSANSLKYEITTVEMQLFLKWETGLLGHTIAESQNLWVTTDHEKLSTSILTWCLDSNYFIERKGSTWTPLQGWGNKYIPG